MRIAATAWRLRESARDAVVGGDLHRAFRLAADAERLQRTPRGDALRILAQSLVAISLGTSASRQDHQ